MWAAFGRLLWRRGKGGARPASAAALAEGGDLRAIREIECWIVGAGGEREPALLQPGTPVLHVAEMMSGGAVLFTTFSAPFGGEGWRPCVVPGELIGVAEAGMSDGIPIPIPPDYVDISANPRGGEQ